MNERLEAAQQQITEAINELQAFEGRGMLEAQSVMTTLRKCHGDIDQIRLMQQDE